MFSCTCLPVSFSRSPRILIRFSAATTDDDARARGVDVHPNPLSGALDLDLRDARSLHALTQQLANLHVLFDVVAVALALLDCQRTNEW